MQKQIRSPQKKWTIEEVAWQMLEYNYNFSLTDAHLGSTVSHHKRKYTTDHRIFYAVRIQLIIILCIHCTLYYVYTVPPHRTAIDAITISNHYSWLAIPLLLFELISVLLDATPRRSCRLLEENALRRIV